MPHVFVETNWVVAYAAPAPYRVPAALELLTRAAKGEFTLHLPSICISEARHPILKKYRMRNEADRVREFLLWGRDEGIISPESDEVTRRVLSQMEEWIKNDLAQLDDVLKQLSEKKGLEVFPLNEEMLKRFAEFSFRNLDLKPFDQAILSAILVYAEYLSGKGEQDFAFCESDGDLQPWDSENQRKPRLADLYDKARVWVYGDFLLEAPEKPPGWGN